VYAVATVSNSPEAATASPAKPTDLGQVTSVEAYDANGSLIVQFFGIQQKGQDAPRWAEIVESLPRQQAKVA
jgi:putative hemin transport protein